MENLPTDAPPTAATTYQSLKFNQSIAQQHMSNQTLLLNSLGDAIKSGQQFSSSEYSDLFNSTSNFAWNVIQHSTPSLNNFIGM
jgi:hypothetical protein